MTVSNNVHTRVRHDALTLWFNQHRTQSQFCYERSSKAQ